MKFILLINVKMPTIFILLINVKMPTIVGILTFISRINVWFLRFKPEMAIDFGYFGIHELFRFHAELS